MPSVLASQTLNSHQYSPCVTLEYRFSPVKKIGDFIRLAQNCVLEEGIRAEKELDLEPLTKKVNPQ